MEGAWEKQQSANRQQPTVKDKNLSYAFFGRSGSSQNYILIYSLIFL